LPGSTIGASLDNHHFHLSSTAKYQKNFTYAEMDNALDAVLEEVALAT
jgi:hypothetical protein